MSSFGNKPIASLSLDLDNKWSYMKTHGDAGWNPSRRIWMWLCRVRSLFRDRGLTITYFIVGQDAALDKNHDALGQITADGHEAGNHLLTTNHGFIYILKMNWSTSLAEQRMR